jgi:hypothetical protein
MIECWFLGHKTSDKQKIELPERDLKGEGLILNCQRCGKEISRVEFQ